VDFGTDLRFKHPVSNFALGAKLLDNHPITGASQP